jgi:hypothetical protein
MGHSAPFSLCLPHSMSLTVATQSSPAGTPRNDELRTRVRQLYVDEHRSMNEVAEMVNRSSERVRQLLRTMGVPVRPRSECSRLAFASGRAEPDRPAFRAEDEPAMIAAYQAGESIKELARLRHSSSTTVRAMLLRHGVVLRPRDTQGAQARARIAAARRPAHVRRLEDQQRHLSETIAAYYATASGSKVAQLLERDSLWVYSALRMAGVAIGKNASAPRVVLDGQLVREAYDAGDTLARLAAQYEVSSAVIVHALMRAGWALDAVLTREGLPTTVKGMPLAIVASRASRQAAAMSPAPQASRAEQMLS